MLQMFSMVAVFIPMHFCRCRKSENPLCSKIKHSRKFRLIKNLTLLW